MASFTDSAVIDKLTSFTPYIQQLPVEAMVFVGRQKQEQYNQGVQKIQTAIDNIAGLDIAKDADKAYLQSKINELGNNLKFVAAGDFSDFQLVNSVNGMTGQLVKDTNVQNAVASTARLRKEQQYKEEARKAGKSSVQNDWYFNNGVNDYLNSSTIGESFTGKYVDYTDIDKKLREVADKIHEYDNTIDIPFTYDAKGNKIVDAGMLELNTKGKSASKILANFYDSLNENDINQLNIDAQYHYKDKTKEDFISDVNKSYQTSVENAKQKIIDLSTELATTKNLSDADRAKKAADIEDINKGLNNGTLEKERDSQLQKINDVNNIDSLKYQIYTNQKLNNLAKDLSYESVQKLIKTNPYRQALEFDKRLDFDYAKLRQDNAQWTATYLQKERELNPNPLPRLTKDGVIKTDVGELTVEDVNSKIVGLEGVYDKKTNSYTVQGDRQILDSRYSKTIVPKEVSGLGQTATAKYLNDIYNQYKLNPSIIDSKSTNKNIKDYLIERKDLENRINIQKSIRNTVAADPNIKLLNDDVDKYIKNIGGVVDTNGKQLFSSRDLYEVRSEFNNSFKTTIVSGSSPSVAGSGAGGNITNVDFTKFLNRYKGTPKEVIAKSLVAKYYGNNISPTAKVIANRANEISNIVSPKIAETSKKIKEIQNKLINDLDPQYQYKERALVFKPSAGPKDPSYKETNMVQQILSLVNSEQLEFGGPDANKSSQGNLKTLNTLLKTPGTRFTLRNHKDGTGELVVSNDDKDTQQVINIPPSMLREAFSDIVKTNPLEGALTLARSSADKSSGPLNHNDPSVEAINAYYSGNDIPNLIGSGMEDKVRVNIIGNTKNTGNSPTDTYFLRVYKFNGNKWIYADSNSWLSEGGIQNALYRELGTQTINQIK